MSFSWRTVAVASAQNASAEDRFIEANRSADIGDSEKLRHRESVARGHLIVLLLDVYRGH